MKLAYYEFFAGAGMARAGLGDSWRCVLANDIDPQKGASYAANFGSEQLRVCNVANLTTDDIPGRPDLCWASPRNVVGRQVGDVAHTQLLAAKFAA